MAYLPAAERRAQLVQAAITVMTRSGVAVASKRAIAKADSGISQIDALAGADLDLREDLTAQRHAVEDTAAELLTEIASRSRLVLATRAEDIAALLVSGLFGLHRRQRLLAAAGQETPDRESHRLAGQLAGALIPLCVARSEMRSTP